jgi:hypothetical protein
LLPGNHAIVCSLNLLTESSYARVLERLRAAMTIPPPDPPLPRDPPPPKEPHPRARGGSVYTPVQPEQVVVDVLDRSSKDAGSHKGSTFASLCARLLDDLFAQKRRLPEEASDQVDAFVRGVMADELHDLTQYDQARPKTLTPQEEDDAECHEQKAKSRLRGKNRTVAALMCRRLCSVTAAEYMCSLVDRLERSLADRRSSAAVMLLDHLCDFKAVPDSQDPAQQPRQHPPPAHLRSLLLQHQGASEASEACGSKCRFKIGDALLLFWPAHIPAASSAAATAQPGAQPGATTWARPGARSGSGARHSSSRHGSISSRPGGGAQTGGGGRPGGGAQTGGGGRPGGGAQTGGGGRPGGTTRPGTHRGAQPPDPTGPRGAQPPDPTGRADWPGGTTRPAPGVSQPWRSTAHTNTRAAETTGGAGCGHRYR